MRSNSPRNSRYHHRRSPSPYDHRKRQKSLSPSPPRASKNELQAIRITVNNVPSRPKKFTIFKAREEFQGLEQDSLPRSKDQKKIQIEIRRSIPKHRESQSPVRRSIRDHTTVFILRKKVEGKYPIFDRDEIKNFQAVPEQRVIAIIPDKFELKSHKSRAAKSRSRSRSPMDYSNRMHSNEPRKSVHKRLGKRDQRDRIKSRYDSSPDEDQNKNDDADPDDHVLDREELESRRPQVKPWEINPEYVPKKGYYFEHDNREDDRPRYVNRDRGRGRGRGGRGGRGGHFFKRNRYDGSPDWKHDKFHEVQDNQDEEMFENY